MERTSIRYLWDSAVIQDIMDYYRVKIAVTGRSRYAIFRFQLLRVTAEGGSLLQVSGESRIFGEGVHMYKGCGVRFAIFYPFSLNIP